jgi:hypothetical protein
VANTRVSNECVRVLAEAIAEHDDDVDHGARPGIFSV